MKVERADFDDLVTLVTQAPTWEKLTGCRASGSCCARSAREGGCARPDPRALDVEARARDAQGAGPAGERRVPGGKRLLGAARELARAPARGERGQARERRARAAARGRRRAARLGRGLHAACEPADRCARERIAPLPEVANALADNLPAPKVPSRKSRRRRGRRRAAAAAKQARNGSSRRTGRRAARREHGRDDPAAVTTASRGPRDRRALQMLATSEARLRRRVPVTAISPCVLPCSRSCSQGRSGGAAGRLRDHRRASSSASSSRSGRRGLAPRQLGLPDDLLRNLAIALLFLVAATLLFPQLGVLIERPLAALVRRRPRRARRRLPARRGARARVRALRGAGLAFVTVLAAAATRRRGLQVLPHGRVRPGGRRPCCSPSRSAGSASRHIRAASAAAARARRRIARPPRSRLRPRQPLRDGCPAGRGPPGEHSSELSAERGYARAGPRLEGSQAGLGRAGIPGLRPAPDFRGIEQWINTPRR